MKSYSQILTTFKSNLTKNKITSLTSSHPNHSYSFKICSAKCKIKRRIAQRYISKSIDDVQKFIYETMNDI